MAEATLTPEGELPSASEIHLNPSFHTPCLTRGASAVLCTKLLGFVLTLCSSLGATLIED